VRLVTTQVLVFLLFSSVTMLGVAIQPAQADEAPTTAPPAHPRNGVVLVTIDSLRADHLGCYSAGGHPTPGLDSLALLGVRFQRAYATSPSTLPSTASVLTG
jgi:predicted AlkP superfamily pyrophosphatase or phosphodiesterase